MKGSRQRSAVSGQRHIVVVTGTDTGVGKTVLTSLLTRQLCAGGTNAVALKPLCSGGRGDAMALHAASDGVLTLDEVNPWHFRAALAPVLAARQEGRGVKLAEVVAQVRTMARRFEVVVVEGAGGLLSPLGEDFDTRNLIVALRAVPIVVIANQLGAVNQARLVLEALPKSARGQAQVVLVEPRKPDASARTNAALLLEWMPDTMITRLPWVDRVAGWDRSRRLTEALGQLAQALRNQAGARRSRRRNDRRL